MYCYNGRPSDIIWQYFIEISQENKLFAKCKNCEYIILQNAGRMKKTSREMRCYCTNSTIAYLYSCDMHRIEQNIAVSKHGLFVAF